MNSRPLKLRLALPHESVTLLTSERRVDHRQIAAASLRVARALRARGLVRGDRVLWVVRSSVDAALVLAGALRAGLVVVPANAGYQEAELAHVLADSGANLIVVEEPGPVVDAVAGDVPVLTCAALVRAEPDELDCGSAGEVDVNDGLDDSLDDDLALLIYTSGTTGRAKGCGHTWRSLAAGVDALMQRWQVSPGDVVVHALPLFHVHGLCVALLGAWSAGAGTLLLPRFSPEAVIDAVARGGTVLMSVPTMVHRLIQHLDQHPEDAAVLARLRLWTCGSAALPAAQLSAVRDRTGVTILERYGMSETLITLSNPLVGERRPGAVGWPLDGVEVRVVGDELWVRGPMVMKGYWRRPDADRDVFVDDAAGGARWFKTGDVVDVDGDGCVRVVGRASQDILKVGGYKLSAREIEDALAAHEDVAEVAVVGVPDDEWGERVCAVVVARPGRSPTLASLQAAVHLHEAKKPRALLLLPTLPRNAMGKVLKHELKAVAREQSWPTTTTTR
ncbi:MAG: AMP-binding protein [Deltaproteobacteria bacterium]|nr:AMP-binding protein [Deltaproteobacteria bacterium]